MWFHDLIGSGRHGDLVRLIAGGRSASGQIEYVKQYGSANPNAVLELEAKERALEAEIKSLESIDAETMDKDKEGNTEL